MKPHRPEDIFRAEKERALTVRNSQHARLLAEAKAAFDKLMAEGQAARKSGRPRKHPLPPLKTSSSSRLPVKTPFLTPAPVAAPKPAPAKPPAPAKAVKAEANAAKPTVKAPLRKAPAKAAKSASSKSKPKRSARR